MKDNEETQISTSPEVKNKLLECGVCSQKFRFIKALRKHEMRHLGRGGFVCRTCGMTFTTAATREKHRDKEHKILRCRICNIKFKTDAEYLHHVNSLHNGRDRELCMCNDCGKQFKTKGELTHHVNSKCGTVKQYKCNVCGQSLMTAGSLINHMLRHNDKKTYMCNFCAKTFISAGELTIHERTHTQEKAYICQVCNKGFCHRQSLITHSTLHTGIRPYQCEGCGKAFSCVGNLLKHRKSHKDTCAKVELTSHRVQNPATKMKVQANTPSSCKLKKQELQKKIKQAEEIVATLNQNINDLNNSTSNSITLQYSDEFKMENSHNSLEKGNETNEDCTKILNPCTIITTNEFYDSNDINEHNLENKNVFVLHTSENINYYDNSRINQDIINLNKTNNGINQANQYRDENINEWKTCSSDVESNCDDSFSDDSIDLITRQIKSNENKEANNYMKTKQKSKHKQTRTVDRNKLKKFISERIDADSSTCKYCGSLYKNVGWLMRHEEKCASDKKTKGFKCSCCNSTFESKEECSSHQQYKHADKLTCKDCNKIFANPDTVKAHTNFYHKGVPRKVYIYVCDKCGKLFKQKAVLITHEKNNCGDGPMFVCSTCDKSFSNKHVLKSHLRIHEPEKSLLCKFCGKSFHWKGQLKIHERSHTGEKPFNCIYCSKSFSYRESLLTHSSLHTGIKRYLCVACGSRFSCIGNLLKHKRNHASTCGMTPTVKDEETVTMRH